jgi:hypothetical protein
MNKKSNQSDKETARIRDEALKRALQMPHKPHEPLGKTNQIASRKKKGSAPSAKKKRRPQDA